MDFTLLREAGIEPERGLVISNASSFSEIPASNTFPVLVTGVRMAAELETVRRALLSLYDEKEIVTVISRASREKRETEIIALTGGEAELWIFFTPETMKRRADAAFTLEPILSVMRCLREEGGCPWDRAQDHKTLRTYLLQEAYEVIDAIDKKDMENLREELGDVLYQIVFHARIAEEAGLFSMQDVVDGIAEKMVRRHPFVFGEISAEETLAVLGNWETRKLAEKHRRHLLDGLSESLPSLAFACIMQRKVSSICKERAVSLPEAEECFDSSWEKAIRSAEDDGGTEKTELCFGEALFAAVCLLRSCGIDPELALHRFNHLVAERLCTLEDELQREGKCLMALGPMIFEELKKTGV